MHSRLMNLSMNLALLATLGAGLARADGDGGRPLIEVEDSLLPDPASYSAEPDATGGGIPADAGEWLRSVPGVSGKRLGGHGIDPVIRGQSGNRLNILLDDAYVHGGCPNRMDPPTSYAPLDSYERVTVLRGSQTVRFGGGGSGGTVLLERHTEAFSAGEGFRGKLSGAYGSNGERRSLHADVATGTEKGFVRALVGRSKSNDYEDGDGDKVRSAYEERGGLLILGLTPDADTRLEASIEATRGEDILFAGRMDAPKSDDDVYRLKFSRQGMDGFVSQVKAELYYSDVDHVMDNFSLRTLSAPMKMEVPSSSNTGGGRLSVEHVTDAGALWTLGIDVQINERSATRYAGPTLATVNSLLWPDVELDQRGLFLELAMDLSDERRLGAGLRYDLVQANAGDAGRTLGGALLGPDQLYSLYYGSRADDVTEHNLGGFLRLEQDLSRWPVTLFAGLSRSLRTADATERFIAGNNPADPTLRWVGNPRLDPERHRQLEAGANLDAAGWQLRASVYVDYVADYILRDTARGQDGILQTDLATIYRNVDARLSGGELDATYRWGRGWSSRLTLARVFGSNLDDGGPLAQIPPLEYSLDLDYRAASWTAGGRIRGATRQDRVDDDPATGSGLDNGETAGWTTLDLYASLTPRPAVELKLGIDNLLDKTYAEHLNRANDFDPVQVQINEPGRSIWAKAKAVF